jgi:hypothetical protein
MALTRRATSSFSRADPRQGFADARAAVNPKENQMQAYERYGIEVGQAYARADGGPGQLVVKDVATYASADDVVVYDVHT